MADSPASVGPAIPRELSAKSFRTHHRIDAAHRGRGNEIQNSFLMLWLRRQYEQRRESRGVHCANTPKSRVL